MTRVIVDKEMLAKLHDLRERLELYDESGCRLAVIQPEPSRDRSLYDGVQAPISEEELRRREGEIGKVKCFTTAEVMAHLKGLEKS